MSSAPCLRSASMQRRHQRLVPGGERRDPHRVHVVLDRLARGLFRRLEERADVDVEAEIGEGRRDDLGAPVVAVLPELRDHDPRPAPFGGRERLDVRLDPRPHAVSRERAAVDARHALRRRAVPSPHDFEGARHLADRRAHAHRADREVEQVARAGSRRLRERRERRGDGRAVALRAHLGQARHLRLADRRVVDLADRDRVVVVELELVDADDRVLAAVDARLLLRRGRLDPELRPAALDGARHAADRLDLLEDRPRAVRHVLRQALHHVRARPRIDDAADVRLLLQQHLRVAGDARGEVRRQRDGLVERVRVQRLRAAEHGGHRLDRRAHDVVVRVLLGERPAGRLAVRAQHQRLRVLRRERLS